MSQPKLRVRINQWRGSIGRNGPQPGPFWGVIIEVPIAGQKHPTSYGQRVAPKGQPGTRDEAMALAKEIRRTRRFNLATAWQM